MKKSVSYNVVLSGLFIALGLLLPFATSHAFGIPGTVLQPMYIPVLLAGLLCGPKYGALCGVIIPCLSSLLTGMPAPFPMLPILVGTLFAYGFVSGLLHKGLRWNVYPSMVVAMLSGQVLYGLIFAAIATANGGAIKALSVSAAVITGLPGIAVQLVLVPIIVIAVGKYGKNTPKASQDIPLEQARELIKQGTASCVVILEGKIVAQKDGRGVAPLIDLYENTPQLLNNAYVVDKIIGKGAAMILVLAGVHSVYAEIMSAAAKEFLTQKGVAIQYGRCVDIISNRAGNGICPIEKSVLDINDPEQGYALLKKRLEELRNAG